MVRHGQASFGKANYDELSERGHAQAYKLGQWLAANEYHFSRVCIGGMHRHQQTLDGITRAYQESDHSLPTTQIDTDLNEFDHHSVFAAFMQKNANDPVVIAAASGELRATGTMVHAAITAWVHDHLDELPESWHEFGMRARKAAQRLQENADQTTLVVSSGGLISRIAQAALEVPDERAVDLNISLRNSAISEFHERHQHWRMSMWNALPHLHDARDMWTYF